MSSEVETSLIASVLCHAITISGSISLRTEVIPFFIVGITNRLSRRTWQHREGDAAGFASKYQCKKLVYYEHYRDVRDAIARESQLKKWSRIKKVQLINRLNPRWEDLGADVLQDS